MKTISISPESHDLLMAHGAFDPAVIRKSDGRYLIEIDEEVDAALQMIDDNPDKAIYRMCTTGVGRA